MPRGELHPQLMIHCFNGFCFSICSHKETHKCPLNMRICHIFKKDIRAENFQSFGYTPDTRNGGNIRIPEVAPKNTENNLLKHWSPLLGSSLLTFHFCSVLHMFLWWFSQPKKWKVCVFSHNGFRKHQLFRGFDSAKVMFATKKTRPYFPVMLVGSWRDPYKGLLLLSLYKRVVESPISTQTTKVFSWLRWMFRWSPPAAVVDLEEQTIGPDQGGKKNPPWWLCVW